MTKRMKTLHIMLVGLFALFLTSCDEHRDFPDISTKPGHILLTTGKVVSAEDYKSKGGTPIAVVYYIKQSSSDAGLGYAVYLHDVYDVQFSDSIGSKQGTSADAIAYDGNSNTYAMFASGVSPAARAVYDMWRYGQSAYIPSIAQLRLLFAAKETINPYIRMCGGDPLPDDADECWYWSSTEVEGQDMYKAWLYSMNSGAMQETPKEQAHKIRPIITINE